MVQSMADQLATFLKRPLTPCSLSDGAVLVYFAINPQQFDNQSELAQTTAQTLGGFVFFDYDARPNQITLDGYTGNAGLSGDGGLYDLEQFRMQQGRPNKVLLFRYPQRFQGVRYLRLIKMSDNISTAMHLYNQYQMTFVEMGPQQPAPAVRLQNNPVGLALPIGG